MPNNIEPPEMNNANFTQNATNKEFVIDGISNLFSGVSTYIEE